MLGGAAGMVFALALAFAMNLVAYLNSGAMVLRMFGVLEVDKRTAPGLVGIVEWIADRAGLPMPRVYVIGADQPNAFATGRNPENAAVAVTTGLLRALDTEEIAGVIAHELAHVRNRDTLTVTITATIAGAIGMLTNFALFFGRKRNNPLGIVGAILLMTLVPLAAALVKRAISRAGEYEADRVGAEICGYPLWLASALEKLDGAARRVDNPPAASTTRPPSATRRPHICSSSTRCTHTAATACFRPTRRWRSASAASCARRHRREPAHPAGEKRGGRERPPKEPWRSVRGSELRAFFV